MPSQHQLKVRGLVIELRCCVEVAFRCGFLRLLLKDSFSYLKIYELKRQDICPSTNLSYWDRDKIGVLIPETGQGRVGGGKGMSGSH